MVNSPVKITFWWQSTAQIGAMLGGHEDTKSGEPVTILEWVDTRGAVLLSNEKAQIRVRMEYCPDLGQGRDREWGRGRGRRCGLQPTKKLDYELGLAICVRKSNQ